MDLHLETPGEHLYIRSVDSQGVRVGEKRFRKSLVISAHALQEDWPPQCMDELLDAHLQTLKAMQPEILLLGTGQRQVFLHPRQMASFYQAGIGIEVMKTEAACRTFNVLVSEGRNVVAALMPLKD